MAPKRYPKSSDPLQQIRIYDPETSPDTARVPPYWNAANKHAAMVLALKIFNQWPSIKILHVVRPTGTVLLRIARADKELLPTK